MEILSNYKFPSQMNAAYGSVLKVANSAEFSLSLTDGIENDI